MIEANLSNCQIQNYQKGDQMSWLNPYLLLLLLSLKVQAMQVFRAVLVDSFQRENLAHPIVH